MVVTFHCFLFGLPFFICNCCSLLPTSSFIHYVSHLPTARIASTFSRPNGPEFSYMHWKKIGVGNVGAIVLGNS